MADGKRTVTENKVGLLGDNPSLQISRVKLDGTNYLSWSRSCLLFIQRGLKGYVTREKPKPTITDSTYNQWEAKNSLVMSWLINSMQPHISKGYLLFNTANKIWLVVSLTYSEVGNDAQIYELWNKAVCPKDVIKFQKLVEKERIYDFLAGLNMEYDQIWVQVLGKDPLPSLRQTYSYVQQEESRRSAMIHTVSVEKAGLVSKTTREQTKTGDSSTSNKDQLKCDYCGKPGHTKDGLEASWSTK
ncbi:Retrotransposon Copia-like, N-terminal [Dillenia turbinata]|uniref:Retrotransposon Copia-like, N-terminal n=1 Tax=Dillenia turbinata TaxID=194707 RepID=A0AAN8ZFL5_9MAGN